MFTTIAWVLNSFCFPVNNNKNRKYVLNAYYVSVTSLCHGANQWENQIKLPSLIDFIYSLERLFQT